MKSKRNQQNGVLNEDSNNTSLMSGESSYLAKSRSFHKIEFDEALELVGSGNWYQIRAFIYFSAQWFFAAWILLGSNFILFPAQFEDSFCGDLNYDDCVSKACKANDPQQFMTNSNTSMIGTYHLVCDDYKVSVIQSVPYIGSLIGFFFFSWLADNKGRKLALGASWLLASLGALLLALSWDFYSATIGFFIAGAGVNPAVTIQLFLYKVGKFREYSTIGCQVFYGIGECVMVGIAYLFPNWRHLTLYFMAIPILALNAGVLLIQESPKYVYEKSTQDAFIILNKIAVINKKNKLKIDTLRSILKEKEEKQYTLLDLFKYKSIRNSSIFSSLIFFSIQGVYYGVTFAMSKIGLNMYANTIIIASAETFAYAVTDHFIPKIKRKMTVLVGMILCCILSFCYQFLNPPDDCQMCGILIFQIVLAGIIRFSICFVWTVMYMYITELFPTVVKSLALGIISGAGTIGSASAPYIGSLSDSIGVNPMISLGVMGLIGVGSTLPLHETFGLPLKNKIEELNREEDQLVIEEDEQVIEE